MKNWKECAPGDMPEDLLQITSKETKGHDFFDKCTDIVLVTDEFKKEIRECKRVHSNHPGNPGWFWNMKINFNDSFRIRYWSQKED